MSIECSRRSDYLKRDCEEKGIIVVPAGKKLMKDDYVRELRKWWLNKRYTSENNIPWHLKFMLSIECLQLCRRIKSLKEDQQQLIWNSLDWVAEEKIDGVRLTVVWDSIKSEFHFYSRNNSAIDYLPQDYSDIVYITAKDFAYSDSFVLDCEVISTDHEAETNVRCLTQLQSTAAILALNPEDSIAIQKRSPLKFIVFDCLFDKDRLIDEPWTVRHKHAEKLVSLLLERGFCCELNRVVENTEDNPNAKREYFESIIERNGEGVVLKNKNAVYHACSSRTIDCVKVKRSTNDTAIHDIDAFITDYVVGKDDTRNENMVVGFVFSIKMKKDNGEVVTHHIATCSNVSDFIKEDATTIDKDGNVTMNKSYYFKVATISGQNVSARNLRLTHAVIDQWRPERSADNCEIIEESELKKLVF